MARWDEFTFGQGVPWGKYPPARSYTRGGYYHPRIRNATTAALMPTDSIIESLSVSQEFGLSGLARASVECINPDGANGSVYADGDLIRIEVVVSGRGYGPYVADLGRFRVRTPLVRRVAASPRWSLSLDCVPELEERLRYPVSGDLPALAATIARRFKLLAPDNVTASIPGIIAYLLVTGGITAVRTEGPVVKMQAYIEAADDGYSGPWNLSPQQTAYRVLGTLEEAAGVYTYVDLDGTGVIAARPRSVFDVAPPVRRWSDSGDDAVMDSIERKPLTALEQVQVTNQTSAGTDQIVFVMPEGQGVPVESTLETSVAARNVNTASYPTRATDPSEGQETRARQHAFEESLRAVEVRVRATGDPGLWAGDTVRFADAAGGISGPHLLRRLTHSYPRGAHPRLEATAQPLNEATASVSRAVGATTHEFGSSVLLYLIGSGASGASAALRTLRTGSAAVHSVDAAASLFIQSSFTIEGFFRPFFWAQTSAPANIELALLLVPSAEIYVTGGGFGSTMTLGARLYRAGGTTTITGASVPVADSTWHHVRAVYNLAAATFRLWWDGTLWASATGLAASDLARQYRDLRVLSRVGADVEVAPFSNGLVGFCHVRYRSDAVIADGSNFAVPSAPFTDSDLPCIVHWPCRDVDSDGRFADYLYSTAGNIYGRRARVRPGQAVGGYEAYAGGGATPPF